ncbi:hypothetical protein TMPK1_03560 [Rhodospirillales bacterium TMPK1]|uniref:Uncharacterized protein n=2 Tax=Roseiterribacter gracilis TaxID=2812848 RepID=A0A8S8X998_9PROT|nr:hypothetical protein TMPK1_03560 [Rhodospirillales bacterium TMPK1]
MIAIDWKHRYGAASLDMALKRIASHIELDESDEAIEWTQVATVIAQQILQQDA